MPEELTRVQRERLLKSAEEMIASGRDSGDVSRAISEKYDGLTLRELRASLREADEGPGMAEGLLRSAAQGVTFGFSDELAGLLAKLPGGRTPEEARESERRQHEQFRGEHPVLSTMAEIAGGLAVPGLGAVGTGGRLARIGARALPKAAGLLGGKGLLNIAAKGAALGTTEGALFGAGMSEGGLRERAVGAGIGGLVGGAAGGTLAPILTGIGRAGGRLVRGLGLETAEEAKRSAREAVSHGLRATGVSTVEQVRERAAALPGATILDFNELTRSMGRAVKNVAGEASELVQAVQGRVRGQAQRLARVMLGELDDDVAMKSTDEILQAGKLLKTKLRQRLFGELDTVDDIITTPQLKQTAAQYPVIQSAVKEVEQTAARKIDNFRPSEWAMVDELIEARFRKESTGNIAETAIRRQQTILREQMGVWGQRLDIADLEYSRAIVVDAAFDQGRKLASGRAGLSRLSDTEYRAAVRSLSDGLGEGAEFELARKRLHLGLVKEMEEELGKMADVAQVERVFIEMSGSGKSVLEDVFGVQGLERVRAAARIEREFAASMRAMVGNSSTALQQSQAARLSGSVHWKAAVGRALELATQMSPEQQHRMTTALMETLNLTLDEVLADPVLLKAFLGRPGVARQMAGFGVQTALPVLGGMAGGELAGAGAQQQ